MNLMLAEKRRIQEGEGKYRPECCTLRSGVETSREKEAYMTLMDFNKACGTEDMKGLREDLSLYDAYGNLFRISQCFCHKNTGCGKMSGSE